MGITAASYKYLRKSPCETNRHIVRAYFDLFQQCNEFCENFAAFTPSSSNERKVKSLDREITLRLILLADYSAILLLFSVALGFYNVGTIWAHEVDIFQTWPLIRKRDFVSVQAKHFQKLRYWFFAPVALALAGSLALVFYHPAGSPFWAIYSNLACLLLSIVLTVFFWDRWRGLLSKDPRGPDSPYLAQILRTHWIRTVLINAYAFVLLVWAIISLA
jgi:hypothetical protein